MKITKSELTRLFNSFRRGADGFYSDIHIEAFRSLLKKNLNFLGYDCPNSHDSAERYLCDCGEVIEICNPRQHSYPAFIR